MYFVTFVSLFLCAGIYAFFNRASTSAIDSENFIFSVVFIEFYSLGLFYIIKTFNVNKYEILIFFSFILSSILASYSNVFFITKIIILLFICILSAVLMALANQINDKITLLKDKDSGHQWDFKMIDFNAPDHYYLHGIKCRKCKEFYKIAIDRNIKCNDEKFRRMLM